MIPQRYGPPPRPPETADLPGLCLGSRLPSDPALTICFTDGSQLRYDYLPPDAWDYYQCGALAVTVPGQSGGGPGPVEHVFPLAGIRYVRYQAPA